MDGRMDRQMDGQTDTTSYKMSIWFPCNALQLEKKYVFAVVFVVDVVVDGVVDGGGSGGSVGGGGGGNGGGDDGHISRAQGRRWTKRVTILVLI